MFTIANNQLTFSIPDFSLLAFLSQDRQITTVSGTFFGLEFSICYENFIVNGISYTRKYTSGDLTTTASIVYKSYRLSSVTCNGLDFYFRSNGQHPSYFDLYIVQGGRELFLTAEMIYFKKDPESVFTIYPNGISDDPSILMQISLEVVKLENSRPVDISTYEIMYFRNEDNSIKQTTKRFFKKRFAFTRNVLPMDLSKEQLQQLNFDKLGFRDLQITVA
jgi:hypothetical protein